MDPPIVEITHGMHIKPAQFGRQLGMGTQKMVFEEVDARGGPTENAFGFFFLPRGNIDKQLYEAGLAFKAQKVAFLELPPGWAYEPKSVSTGMHPEHGTGAVLTMGKMPLRRDGTGLPGSLGILQEMHDSGANWHEDLHPRVAPAALQLMEWYRTKDYLFMDSQQFINTFETPGAARWAPLIVGDLRTVVRGRYGEPGKFFRGSGEKARLEALVIGAQNYRGPMTYSFMPGNKTIDWSYKLFMKL